MRDFGRDAARYLASLSCQTIRSCHLRFEALPFSPDTASGARIYELAIAEFQAEATRLSIAQNLVADALTLFVGGKLAARATMPRAAASAAAASRAPAAGSVWSKPPVVRGEIIEKQLGSNLPRSFPVIDRLDNGVATSIKSLDLNAVSYQDPAVLTRTVRGYIDNVAKFNGAKRDGFEVLPREVTGRALDLAIPGAGTAAQQRALGQLTEYGRLAGVTVNVIVLP